jgi:hypothetical protein
MGKASLLMVIGFSTALLMIGSHISKVSSSAMDNYLSYYRSTMAHEIAAAGTNIAARALEQNMYWRSGSAKHSFMGGSFQTAIKVDSSNVQGTSTPRYQIRVTTKATYMDATSVISVLLQRSFFSRFCYYSVKEMGLSWYGSDTVTGPMHTQDNLSIISDKQWGDPVFMGRTTSKGHLIKKNGNDHAWFLGGYEPGVDIPLPTSITGLRDSAKTGYLFNSGFNSSGDSVWMRFSVDGGKKSVVQVKSGNRGGWGQPMPLPPNGVIYVDGANVHISGTLLGRVTVGAGGTTGSTGKGNIYIDDDMQYYNNPLMCASTDMLGLVAENDVVIAKNWNNERDVIVQASIFCRSGSFRAQGYNTQAVSNLYLLGGIINAKRGVVGTYDPDYGYVKKYVYDQRFMFDAPPCFPKTNTFEVVSWFE